MNSVYEAILQMAKPSDKKFDSLVSARYLLTEKDTLKENMGIKDIGGIYEVSQRKDSIIPCKLMQFSYHGIKSPVDPNMYQADCFISNFISFIGKPLSKYYGFSEETYYSNIANALYWFTFCGSSPVVDNKIYVSCSSVMSPYTLFEGQWTADIWVDCMEA